MSARRCRPERVLGLEVWDVMVAEQPLYLVAQERLPGAIVELVRLLCAGAARRRRGTLLPRLDIDNVVLGGGAPLEEICAELVRHERSAQIFEDPLWIAEPGGRALLSSLGAAPAHAVLDVGQTSLKLSVDGERRRLMRPLQEVPLELHARDRLDAGRCRQRTIDFLASALGAAPHLRALVLGLPCEIGDDLTVSGCSYPWPNGDGSLVQDLLRTARLQHVPCLVLNDAELAAASVALNAGVDATLVLTVGLGVGAAYLARV